MRKNLTDGQTPAAGGFEFDVIHTLEARSSFHFNFCKDHLGFDEGRLHREIIECYEMLKRQLAYKQIVYGDLKSALVPQTKKLETAFMFDYTKFESGFYGMEVMNMLLPNLDKCGTRSVLYGDWVSKNVKFGQAFAESYGPSEIEEKFPKAWYGNAVAFYYVNNLTPAGINRLRRVVSTHPAYMGSLDLTYTSYMKAMLSTMLLRAFIQHKGIIIESHEDGTNPDLNEGYLPWDFERAGFVVQTVDTSLYSILLSYKIERPEVEGEGDILLCLNALTPSPIHIRDCVLELDDSRLEYLRAVHGSALEHAALDGLTAQQVKDKIFKQLQNGYIYSMARAKQDETLKFNVVIENPGRSRVLCGLKYFPLSKTIAVITLF